MNASGRSRGNCAIRATPALLIIADDVRLQRSLRPLYRLTSTDLMQWHATRNLGTCQRNPSVTEVTQSPPTEAISSLEVHNLRQRCVTLHHDTSWSVTSSRACVRATSMVQLILGLSVSVLWCWQHNISTGLIAPLTTSFVFWQRTSSCHWRHRTYALATR